MSEIFFTKITNSKLKSFISISSIYSQQYDLYGNIYKHETTLKVFTELSSNKQDGVN